MRFLRLGLLSLICHVTSTWALHESDVGVVDWHKQLIGVPLYASTHTAPVFHNVEEGSIVLTATGNNVLAALNPADGSVVWRYIFEPEDRISGFYKHQDVVAALSGPGGSALRLFDALTGHLVLEKQLHDPQTGHLAEPHHFGKHVAFGATSQKSRALFVLTNGFTVTRIDGASGESKWSWSSPDKTSFVIYTRVVVTPTAVYAVGVAKRDETFTLHVTSLSPETGEVLASENMPSSIAQATTDFLTLNHIEESTKATTPRIVWLEQGSIKSVALTPTLKAKPVGIKHTAYQKLVDVGLADQGQLVAIKTDGGSRVMKLAEHGASLKTIWEFEGNTPADRTAESIFSGGFDKEGSPYIARVYWSNSIKRAAVDVFTAHLADGNGLATGFSFPFESNNHGFMEHVAIEAANPGGWTVLARLVVTTSTGAVQSWDQDKLAWTREESLAAIMVAELVELPEKVASPTHVGEAQENFFARVARQISDAQGLPQYIVNFVKRFATGSYASATSPVADGPVSRDAFGFRQVIVAATIFGKVYGIDTSNGEIIWSRILGLGWAAETGGTLHPVKLFVTKTVSDGGAPEVVLVVQRRSENTLIDTVLFHIEALTGEDVTKTSKTGEVFEGIDLISGPLVEGYLFQNKTKMLVLLDEYLQAYIYPDTPENHHNFATAASSLYFPLRAGGNGQSRVIGHRFDLNLDVSEKFVGYPVWTLSLPDGEDVKALIPAIRGPVASIGKVLGNRATLYKNLNPRLFIVLTAAVKAESGEDTKVEALAPATCGLYLVDSAKGSIVYRVAVPSSTGGVCDVKATLTENWLVYHYYDEDFSGVGQAKGWRMVTVELYEGKAVDEKTRSSELTSFSSENLELTAFEQSYVFPHGITALTTTSTKFGITAKDLIVASRNNRVQSFPRRLLNPRRPSKKPTAEEQEEGLIQYEALLPDDPRRVLSHNYEVANIQRIVTSPALLESTSLVFAYGLDMFLTRVAPSGTFDVLSENFNKVQLVLTVAALAVGIMVAKPMVQRKRLREKWYQ